MELGGNREPHVALYKRMAITYIPSNHGGSLKSSVENRAFSSEEETNFKRGADGVFENFLATGNITCIHCGIHLKMSANRYKQKS